MKARYIGIALGLSLICILSTNYLAQARPFKMCKFNGTVGQYEAISAETKNYKNDNYGFSFDYPTNYRNMLLNPKTAFITDQPRFEMMNCFIINKPPTDEYVEGVEVFYTDKNIINSGGRGKVKLIDTASVAGKQAEIYYVNGLNHMENIYVIIPSGSGYVVVSAYVVNNKVAMSDTFYMVLKSLKLV